MTDSEKLDQLLEIVSRLEKKFGQMSVSGPGASRVSSDRDLDGPHGNPVIRKDPKRWDVSNGSYVGCRFSECPSEYLDILAEFKEWQAGMDDRKGGEENKRKANFNRLDAARARGWSNRLKSGWQAPASERQPGEDDIPFA